MARRKRGHAPEMAGAGSDRWLLTYADMITLLLALFIVLFAMSTIEPMRFQELRRTLAEAFRGQVLENRGATLEGSENVLDPTAPSQQQAQTAVQLQVSKSVASKKFDEQFTRLTTFVSTSKALTAEQKQQVEVVQTERGVVIRLAGDVFFASGSDQMNPRMERLMRRVAADLRHEKRQLRIEGHTDGQPIATAQFPSNWELSGARANTILRFLLAEGISPHRIQGGYYADTKPLVKPQYPAQAISRNRRVDIVILAPGADAPGADEVAVTTATANGNPAGLTSGSSRPALRPVTGEADVIGPIIADISLG